MIVELQTGCQLTSTPGPWDGLLYITSNEAASRDGRGRCREDDVVIQSGRESPDAAPIANQ